MSTFQNDFMFPRNAKEARSAVLALLMIFVIGGVFGFIYEELFYLVDLGYLVKRGTTLGPWIPIYGFGAQLITLSTYALKKRPWLVFLVGGAVCGTVEYITGFLYLNLAHIRLWDYNSEILNFGNIGGFVCLRSVGFFAVSSLVLVYLIIPFVRFLEQKLRPPVFAAVCIAPALLFFMDFFAANALRLY